MTDLQHDVIRGVHHRIDRAHAGQAQAQLHPVWAGALFRALQHTQHEAPIQLRIRDLDAGLSGDRRPVGRQVSLWFAQRLSGQGCQFAGNADHAGVAAHIRQDVDFQNSVAHIFHQRPAGRGVVIQNDDALVLLGDAKLFFGANHRKGINPANFGALEGGEYLPGLVTVVKARAFTGIGHFERFGQRSNALVLEQIGRAGQNHPFTRAVVQAAQDQAVSIGVRHDLIDLRYYNFFRVPG